MNLTSIISKSIIALMFIAPATYANDTVVDVALWSDVHKTLVAAVVAADLVDTLSSEWPFTVFAPVDDAFANLPAGTVDTLLNPENIDMLRSILTYHVLPGNITAAHLKNGLMADTVQGDSVVFQHTNDAWYINNSKIVATDIMAGNGVVHIIDTVIMPTMTVSDSIQAVYELRVGMTEADEMKVDKVLAKYADMRKDMWDKLDARLVSLIDIYMQDNMLSDRMRNMLSLIKYEILSGNTMTNSVVDIAIGSDVHKTLVTAVVEAGLSDTLSSDGPFTVFAPVDSAFVKLPDGTVESLLAEESKASLTNILTYHVVAGAYFASDITDGLMLETVQWDSLEFTIVDWVVNINGMPTLVATDIVWSNWVIHVIGDVLIPTE